MKKIIIIVAAVFALSSIFGSAALANNGPHGNYTADTDTCAGCHRAHTADSGINWVDPNDQVSRSALLFGAGSTKILDFCYTCHGAGGPGAGTDVQNGIFDNSVLDYAGDTDTTGATLNGGGFDKLGGAGGNNATSWHLVNGSDWIAWGENTAGKGADGNVSGSYGGYRMNMDCASCHDPHGSSNYRLLKDKVNGKSVGGYDANQAKPYVVANESGYPLPSGTDLGGFDLEDENPDYAPSYTSVYYANTGNMQKNMSGWCGACHGAYLGTSSSYNSADGVGLATRHRHPVNINVYPMASDNPNRVGDRPLLISTDDQIGRWGDAVELPLEDNLSDADNVGTVDSKDYIGCLTCHRAHGSDAAMSGYADAELVVSGNNVVIGAPDSNTSNEPYDGVKPTDDSALLRADGRGVCERCHNK